MAKENITEMSPSENINAIMLRSELPVESQVEITSRLQLYINNIEEWKKIADSIQITDVTQIDLIERAKEGNKLIKKVRIEIDKIRKDIGGTYYKKYKTINEVCGVLTDIIKPLEESLLEKGRFIEILKEKKERVLHEERILKLNPYLEFASINVNYGQYTEEEFLKIYNTAKLAYDGKQALLAKQEQEEKDAIISLRKKELEELGMVYNPEFNSMSYNLNGNMELDLSIDIIIAKCSNEDWIALKQQTATKILNLTRRYDDVKENERIKDEEYKQQLTQEKEKIVEHTKELLSHVGIPVNNIEHIPDTIIISDIQKLKAFVYQLENINYPVLTENIDFLNKTLSNTIILIDKTIKYLNDQLNKIK